MLFLVALAHAMWHNVFDVIVGTAATAITSLLNHWFVSQNKYLRALDKMVRVLSLTHAA